MDINIIKHNMSDVRKFYESALPQLDMLAAHHNLQFDGSDMSQDDLASLRSEVAQVRKEARLNNDLRDKLRNTTEYVQKVRARVCRGGLSIKGEHWRTEILSWTGLELSQDRKSQKDVRPRMR
jgi:hypothetical protein